MKDTLWGCGSALQDMVYVLNQWLMYGAVFPKARIHVSGKQGVEIGLGPLITISSSVHGECVLSVVTTLGSKNSGSCGEHVLPGGTAGFHCE